MFLQSCCKICARAHSSRNSISFLCKVSWKVITRATPDRSLVHLCFGKLYCAYIAMSLCIEMFSYLVWRRLPRRWFRLPAPSAAEAVVGAAAAAASAAASGSCSPAARSGHEACPQPRRHRHLFKTLFNVVYSKELEHFCLKLETSSALSHWFLLNSRQC